MIHEKPVITRVMKLTIVENAQKASELFNTFIFVPTSVKASVIVEKDEAVVSMDFFDDTYGDTSITYTVGIFMGIYLIAGKVK